MSLSILLALPLTMPGALGLPPVSPAASITGAPATVAKSPRWLLPPPALRARRRNHGPGTSGGGSATASGETLKTGRWHVSVRTDYTEFEHFNAQKAEEKALQSGGFDALDRALVETVTLSYGFSDDLELGASTGYYHGSNFVDAEADGIGGVESSSTDPSGMTDLWLLGKYRLLHDRRGHVAILGGIKFPTGKNDERLASGELLEASSQPGSGSVDGKLGLGYSRYLTPRTTLDAGGAYTLRTSHNGFEVGDRADFGMALSYRMTRDIKAAQSWSVFAELSGIWLDNDQAAGANNPNSGGTFLFAALGVRARLDKQFSLTLAPAIPVVQNLNGEQDEVQFRAALTLSYGF